MTPPAVATARTFAFRFTTLAAGALDGLVVAAFSTAEAQGFYYAMYAIARWQSFGELGFSVVLQQLVARAPNVTALGLAVRFGVRWYRAVALCVLVGLSVAAWIGLPSLVRTYPLQVAVLILAVAANLLTLPALVVREGRGDVAGVYAWRLRQSFGARLVAWTAVASGFIAWAPALERATQAMVGAVAAASSPLPPQDVTGDLHWRRVVAPFQLRIAVGTFATGVPYALIVPATLLAFDAPTAGRTGLGLAVVGALLSLAHAPIQARSPAWTRAVAAGDAAAETRLWREAAVQAFLAYTLAVFAFSAAFALWHGPRMDRLPTSAVFLALGIAQAAKLWRLLLAEAFRARLSEPLVVVDVLEGAVLVVGLPAIAGWSPAAGPALWAVTATAAAILATALWLRLPKATTPISRDLS